MEVVSAVTADDVVATPTGACDGLAGLRRRQSGSLREVFLERPANELVARLIGSHSMALALSDNELRAVITAASGL